MRVKLSLSGDWLIFPVNPLQMSVKHEAAHTSHSILNYGEIVIPDSKKLIKVNFEGFFPQEKAPYVVTDVLQSPTYYVDKLTSWMDSKNVLFFITEECANPIRMKCIITSLEIDEKSGAPEDIYYKIALKEYKDFKAAASTVTFRVETNANNGEKVLSRETELGRVTNKKIPETYMVQSGDTLWKIAKKCVGNGSSYKAIAAYNNIKNLNLIFPGQVLKIPSEVGE